MKNGKWATRIYAPRRGAPLLDSNVNLLNEAPTSKLQAPEKLQAPTTNIAKSDLMSDGFGKANSIRLVLGSWSFSGACGCWYLVLLFQTDATLLDQLLKLRHCP